MPASFFGTRSAPAILSLCAASMAGCGGGGDAASTTGGGGDTSTPGGGGDPPAGGAITDVPIAFKRVLDARSSGITDPSTVVVRDAAA